LFYTDGVNIWNRDHQVMPNGSGLTGDYSTSQIVIVPKPGIPNLYYVFYADNEGGPNGLRYSIVDMNRENGRGDVVATSKNTLLLREASEKCAAVLHCDKSSVWLMTTNYATQEFHAYLITAAGIEPPVKSPVKTANSYCCTSLKFSPNGKWLAFVENTGAAGVDAYLYLFDNKSGIASFKTLLPRNAATLDSYYGLSFSPNSTKLYISVAFGFEAAGVSNQLLQYNVDAFDIPSSKTIVYKQLFTGSAANPQPFGALQNAPDGRIYLARWAAGIRLDTLGVIRTPNELGLACNFNLAGLPLQGRNSLLGLPNFIENYFDQTTSTTSCTNAGNDNLELQLYQVGNRIYLQTNQTGRLCLYDALGRLVGVEAIQPGGRQIMKGQFLAAAMYFWVFETGSEVRKGKVLWLN
jgi:hypothetical protein